MENEQTLVEKLREALQPKGTAPVVKLFLSYYAEKDFVEECLKELDKLIYLVEDLSPLQKVAVKVLVTSSHRPLEYLIK